MLFELDFEELVGHFQMETAQRTYLKEKTKAEKKNEKSTAGKMRAFKEYNFGR